MATVRRVLKSMPQIFIDGTAAEEVNRLKVAAYARVSTEREEQEDSFERQVAHYTTLINARADWQMVGIYADPGITGTKAEKRPDFLRMIQDCRDRKIQKVLVKSISRFARNTVDALNYIRELKDLGISVCFESENIDTMTPGGEVLITILAAMAEQESRTISSNIRWAYQKKFERGEVVINTGLMLGYKKVGKDKDGMPIYEIDEEEAEIVRRIYREYASGASVTRIAKSLQDDEIKTKRGSTRWLPRSIEGILTNEKYTGNAILGKTFKPDVLSKKRQKNDGVRSPQYYVEDTHPAIIDKALFNIVQEQMKQRKEVSTKAVGSTKFTSKYPFSGLLVCGECGAKLRRHVRTMGSGEKVPAWGCSNRIINGRSECDSHHVNENTLQKTYLEALRAITDNADEIIDMITVKTNGSTEVDAKSEAKKIADKIAEIQESVFNLHKQKQNHKISDAEYKAQIAKHSEQIKKYEAQQGSMQADINRAEEAKIWLDSFKNNIRTGTVMTADDCIMMRTMVEEMVIYEDRMEIHFRCGVVINQEYIS